MCGFKDIEIDFFLEEYFFGVFGNWVIWEDFFEHLDEVSILEYLFIDNWG